MNSDWTLSEDGVNAVRIAVLSQSAGGYHTDIALKTYFSEYV